jgi:hypothetical protein
LGSAAARLREFIFAVEAAVTLEEVELLARWRSAESGRRRTPRSRKASAQVQRRARQNATTF